MSPNSRRKPVRLAQESALVPCALGVPQLIRGHGDVADCNAHAKHLLQLKLHLPMHTLCSCIRCAHVARKAPVCLRLASHFGDFGLQIIRVLHESGELSGLRGRSAHTQSYMQLS